MMELNPQASTLIKSVRTNNTWATISGSIGGFMVGYPLGVASGGGIANWTMAGIRGGLIVTTIRISVKANKQAKGALVAYNETQKSTPLRETEFKLHFTDNGIGVPMHF
ncbi:MAG TPA: hypothetical protein VM884_11010 [Flavisolibacter sp.]|nr:hypothetical protein [Flavisolibacter sp.]